MKKSFHLVVFVLVGLFIINGHKVWAKNPNRIVLSSNLSTLEGTEGLISFQDVIDLQDDNFMIVKVRTQLFPESSSNRNYFKVETFEEDGSGLRTSVGIVTAVVNKSRAVFVRIPYGEFDADAKTVFVDLYDTDLEILARYSIALTAQNLDSQKLSSNTSPACSAEVSTNQDFVDCFFELVSFDTSSRVVNATSVQRLSSGKYIVSVPGGGATRLSRRARRVEVKEISSSSAVNQLGGEVEFLNITASQGDVAPIVLNSGTLLSQVKDGALEFNGDTLYFTVNGTRKALAFTDDISSSSSGGGTTIFNPTVNVSDVVRFSTVPGSLSAGRLIISSGSGDDVTVAGNNTTVSGTGSLSWGSNTNVSGLYSTAFGNGTTASADYANAWGFSNSAIAVASTAWGSGSFAANTASTAWGIATISSGIASTSFGGNSQASGNYSTVIGQFVNGNAANAVTIGYGNSISDRLVNAEGSGNGALMVGFNSNAATLFVGPSDGGSTVGNVGIANEAPSSNLELGSKDDTVDEYLHIDSENGAPPSADCDADAERGRMIVDDTNNRLYVCLGAARGWDYSALTD